MNHRSNAVAAFHLRGVRIEIGRSLPVGLAALAAGAFPIIVVVAPELNVGAAAAVATFLAIAVALSLLAHELAHAAGARSRGLGVARIRLWGLGALCERTEMATRASDQMVLVAAGPAANLLIGAAALAASAVLPAGPAVGLRLIGGVNVLIAVTNLVPILPFDGGQVVASLLWHVTGDGPAAYQRVRRFSRGVAAVTVLAGIGLVLSGTVVAAGVVLAVLGAYLLRLSLPRAHPRRGVRDG